MFLLLEPSFTLFQGTGRVRRAMEAMTELLPSLPLLTCILVPGDDTNIYSPRQCIQNFQITDCAHAKRLPWTGQM